MKDLKEKIKQLFTTDSSVVEIYKHFNTLINSNLNINCAIYNKIVLSIFDNINNHYSRLYKEVNRRLADKNIKKKFLNTFTDFSKIDEKNEEIEDLLDAVRHRDYLKDISGVNNFTTCSDIHGDFMNLINIIRETDKRVKNYLFLGDIFDTFNGAFNHYNGDVSLYDICNFEKINDDFSFPDCINSNKIAFGYFSSIVVFYILMFIYFKKEKNIYFILGNHELNHDVRKFYFFIFLFYGLMIDEKDKTKIIFLSYLKNSINSRDVVFSHYPITYNYGLMEKLYIHNYHVYKILTLILYYILDIFVSFDISKKDKEKTGYLSNHIYDLVNQKKQKINNSYFDYNIELVGDYHPMFINLFIVNTFDDLWDTELNKRKKKFSVYYNFQKFNRLICYLLHNFYHGLYNFGDVRYQDCIEKLKDKLKDKFDLANKKYEEQLKDKTMLFSYSVVDIDDDKFYHHEDENEDVVSSYKTYFFSPDITRTCLNIFGHTFSKDNLVIVEKTGTEDFNPYKKFKDPEIIDEPSKYLINIDKKGENIVQKKASDIALIGDLIKKGYLLNGNKLKSNILKKYWIVLFLCQSLYYSKITDNIEQENQNKFINTVKGNLITQIDEYKTNIDQDDKILCLIDNKKIKEDKITIKNFKLQYKKIKYFSLDWGSSYFQVTNTFFKYQKLKLNINKYFYNDIDEKDSKDLAIIYYSPALVSTEDGICQLFLIHNQELYIQMDRNEKIFNYFINSVIDGQQNIKIIPNNRLLDKYVNYCNNEVNYLITSDFSFKKLDKLINNNLLKNIASDQYKKVKEIQDKIFSLIYEQIFNSKKEVFDDKEFNNIVLFDDKINILINPPIDNNVLSNLLKTAFLICKLNNEEIGKISINTLLFHVEDILTNLKSINPINELYENTKLKNQYELYLISKILNYVKRKINQIYDNKDKIEALLETIKVKK